MFLEQWEKIHNPDFKVHQMVYFRAKFQENRYHATTQMYISETGATGIISKSGRYRASLHIKISPLTSIID